MRTLANESIIAISWLEEQGWVRFDQRIPVVSPAGRALLAEIREMNVHRAAKFFDERGAHNPHFALQAFLALGLEIRCPEAA